MTTTDQERIIGVLLQNVQAEQLTISGVHIGDVYQLAEPPPLWSRVPALPNHFVGRGQLVSDVVQRLLDRPTLALGVHGLPGVGKSALAIVVAHHPLLLAHFVDGVLWASLGPTSDVMSSLRAWAEALNIKTTDKDSPQKIAEAVRNAIGHRKILVIIDDAWQPEAAQIMRCGGPNCGYFLTTRDLGIARNFAGTAQVIEISPLQEKTSFELLQQLAPEACATNPAVAQQLARAVGGLPLALELIGGFLATPEQSIFPELSEAALKDLSNPMRRLQLASQRLGAESSRPVTLQDTITLSLDHLPSPTVDAFYALGTFAPEPASFDLDAARAVTGVDLVSLATLVARNLVKHTGPSRLGIHQVVADVAQTKVTRNARLAHAGHYATTAEQVYQLHTEQPKHVINGEAWALYKEEQVQIEAAWQWVLKQESSAKTDKLLVQFTHLTAFVPLTEPHESEEKRSRLSAAAAAAERSGDTTTGAMFLEFTALYLQQDAFDLYRMGDFSKASLIYQKALDTIRVARANPVDWTSIFAGELGESYSQLLGRQLEYLLLSELGKTYVALNEPGKALEYYQEMTQYTRESDNPLQLSSLLFDMFEAHFALKRYPQAAELLKERLALLREHPGEKGHLITTLGNLGACFYNIGDKLAALDYANQAIEEAQRPPAASKENPQATSTEGDQTVKSTELSAGEANIVNSCLSLAAEIYDEFDQHDHAANCRIYNLILLNQLYQYHVTTEREQAEIMAKFFGGVEVSKYEARWRELVEQLADVHQKLANYLWERGNFNKAIEYSEGQLNLLRALGDPVREVVVMARLDLLCRQAGDVEAAKRYSEQRAIKMGEIEQQPDLLKVSLFLSTLYVRHEQFDQAIEVLDYALQAARHAAEAQSELDLLNLLGAAHMLAAGQSGQLLFMRKAIEDFEAGYALATQLDNQAAQAHFQNLLSKARQQEQQQLLFTQGGKVQGESGTS